MKTALITGITGQDGTYLSRLLLGKGYRVFGIVPRSTRFAFENLDYLGVTKSIEFLDGDMADQGSLMRIVRQTRPDEVYNLAAQSFVAASWDQAALTTEVNALGVLFLLEAIRSFVPNARFYQASTSEMYGSAHIRGCQTEGTPFHPRSPYAISKLYAYWMTVNFRESYGMFCCNGILFNHESPIRGKEFVTRKITDGVARIKAGLQDKIGLGNLDSKRDWGFAGDYVEAMRLMLQQKEPNDYIVCTGTNHSIREFLDEAFKCVGIKDWSPYIYIDPARKRPADVVNLRGRLDKARKQLGWKPKVGFKQLVRMMVDADVKRYGV
jgi:GDPmannose 4,6-dehydratase